MAAKRSLSQPSFDADPVSAWNAFVDLIAVTDPQTLDPHQRPAALAFQYDAEIQNGGHFQYFENHGLDNVSDTIAALRSLGAELQADVLAEAARVASQKQWGSISSAEQYVQEQADFPLDPFDDRYYECEPSILDILESHLKAHPERFIHFGAA